MEGMQQAKITPEAPAFDENGLPKELWPYKEEMQGWVKQHVGELNTFLEYNGRPHKIVCGKDFFHRPADNVVSLSVPFFKECKEGKGMTIDQIFFASLHEFAHLKSMMELDLAGMENMMEQFRYEGSKTIRDKEDPAKYAALGSTYRSFYNILEDGLVNTMVERTVHFGDATTEAGRRRNQEIKDLYTEQFFALYNKTGPKEEDKKILKKEDYIAGFDYGALDPQLKRAGQFMTHFIKGQMTGLEVFDVKNIYDVKTNPEGMVKMEEDTAIALGKPLAQAYDILLAKVVAKYEKDLGARKRYNEFMASSMRVPIWDMKGCKATEVGFDTVHSVVPLRCMSDYRTEEYKEKDAKGVEQKYKRIVCDTGSKINLSLARILYREEVLETIRKEMELKSISSMSFLDLYKEFKKTEKAKDASWTRPMKYGQVERTRIMRKALEPIYTLLCILDDSFDVTLPDSPETNKGEGGEGDSKEQQQGAEEWKTGDRVKNDDVNSPNFGKKGVIRTVLERDENGKPTRVKVEYEEDVAQSSMATKARPPKKMSGIEESVDTKDLILMAKKGKSGSGSGADDPRRKEFEDEDEEDGDKDEEDAKPREGEGDESDKKNDKKNEQPENSPSEGGKPKEGKPKKNMDAGWSPLKEWLDSMIDVKKEEMEKEAAEEAKKSPEAQKRRYEDVLTKRLMEEVERLKESKQNQEEIPDITEEDIREYIALENKLAPMLEVMAQRWLEIINNIATKIEIFRDKYYFTGKIDLKKVQRYLPEMEAGLEVDQRRVFEQFIERIDSDVRPQMLRVGLLVDNSGSMENHVNEIRTSVMLLLGSLRSFRNLFRDRMKDILGPQHGAPIDVVCDSEIRLFDEHARLVMPFVHNDMSFIDAEASTRSFPEMNPMQEAINTIISFKKIRPYGGTYDLESWKHIVAVRDNPDVRRYIKEKRMSDVVFQISDGGIGSDPEQSGILVKRLRDIGVKVAGFAIGADADSAAESLSARLGPNVIKANTPEEIVNRFGDLLRDIIVENVEKPMEDYLEKLMTEAE